MRAVKFRVQNFRNVEDSGWVCLDKVTCFVGRNESGKTALLKALHKFNPGSPEPYDPQREFPRDRYTRDYIGGGSEGDSWPVCSVEFDLAGDFQAQAAKHFREGEEPPSTVTVTRYYSGDFSFAYQPTLPSRDVTKAGVKAALKAFASRVRRLQVLDEDPEESIDAQRARLLEWKKAKEAGLQSVEELRSEDGVQYLRGLLDDADTLSNPNTADMVEALQQAVEPTLEEIESEPLSESLDALVERSLPVYIYFEDYGILDSAIWLPRFVEDLRRDPSAPAVRTVNAMFKHVRLDPKEIERLGGSEAARLRAQGQQPTQEHVVADEKSVEKRAILLNAASLDISRKFSDWWSQRRHRIRYHADGEYFRIWVADELRPDVEIELESRSKGFQWFFSFYLVFLVESEEGHKDAVLLLDEPGLHLHPTAQQELISFFEALSETNQVVYTTHSPFLIDGERLHRVRPVTEDDSGHSHITEESWPEDRETIFPLQAAAGYAMIRGLFTHRKNVLVEGMSDFYYLQVLSQQCSRSGRAALPDDIYITPCGGTRNVGRMASLFLGHEVRPLVLLDGDEAGRVRKNALLKKLYAGHDSGILMLDEVLGRPGGEVEIEDVLDENLVLAGLEAAVGPTLSLDSQDTPTASLPSRIESTAKQQGIELPESWKTSVALHLVSSWAEQGTTLPDDILATAASLFAEIDRRFQDGEV